MFLPISTYLIGLTIHLLLFSRYIIVQSHPLASPNSLVRKRGLYQLEETADLGSIHPITLSNRVLQHIDPTRELQIAVSNAVKTTKDASKLPATSKEEIERAYQIAQMKLPTRPYTPAEPAKTEIEKEADSYIARLTGLETDLLSIGLGERLVNEYQKAARQARSAANHRSHSSQFKAGVQTALDHSTRYLQQREAGWNSRRSTVAREFDNSKSNEEVRTIMSRLPDGQRKNVLQQILESSSSKLLYDGRHIDEKYLKHGQLSKPAVWEPIPGPEYLQRLSRTSSILGEVNVSRFRLAYI